MSNHQCNFRLEKEDFRKLSPEEQGLLVYNCLMDLQEKVDWKWKRVMVIGAIAGLIGGFCHSMFIKIFGFTNI